MFYFNHCHLIQICYLTILVFQKYNLMANGLCYL